MEGNESIELVDSSPGREIIQDRVERAMAQRFRLELADANGALSEERRRDALEKLFRELALGMGLERFALTPVEALDQFSVMSVVKNHDTQGLLKSLVNSFIIAYMTPETSDEAFQCLEKLEALRKTVGDNRRKKKAN